MIKLIFEFGNETILVVINGNDIKFGNTLYGAQLSDISGIKLSYDGVIKEFPDLEGDDNWENEATIRFKDYIKSLKTEEEKAQYIQKELESCGYIGKLKERKGFRPISLR